MEAVAIIAGVCFLMWLFRPNASADAKQALASLTKLGERTMSAISDFAAKQAEFNARQAAAVEGLKGDVQALNDKITELQNTPGVITPEDQALLDQLQAQGEAMTTKLEALDAATPPAVPVE